MLQPDFIKACQSPRSILTRSLDEADFLSRWIRPGPLDVTGGTDELGGGRGGLLYTVAGPLS